MYKIKKIVSGFVCLCMLMCLIPITVHAEPVPALTNVEITDLCVDDNNEIHVEIKITGTQKQHLCWVNEEIVRENYNESIPITSKNRVIGEYQYYHTGLYNVPENYGKTVTVKYQATNARQPWNTIIRTRVFVIPRGE